MIGHQNSGLFCHVLPTRPLNWLKLAEMGSLYKMKLYYMNEAFIRHYGNSYEPMKNKVQNHQERLRLLAGGLVTILEFQPLNVKGGSGLWPSTSEDNTCKCCGYHCRIGMPQCQFRLAAIRFDGFDVLTPELFGCWSRCCCWIHQLCCPYHHAWSTNHVR